MHILVAFSHCAPYQRFHFPRHPKISMFPFLYLVRIIFGNQFPNHYKWNRQKKKKRSIMVVFSFVQQTLLKFNIVCCRYGSTTASFSGFRASSSTCTLLGGPTACDHWGPIEFPNSFSVHGSIGYGEKSTSWQVICSCFAILHIGHFTSIEICIAKFKFLRLSLILKFSEDWKCHKTLHICMDMHLL